MAVDIAAVLTANISEFKAKMAEADVSMKTMTESGSSNMQKLSSIGKGATLAIGAVAVGIGAFAVNMGNQFEEAQAQMDNAFKNAGANADNYKGQIASVNNQMTNYGYTNAQTEGALGRLITVTGNVKGSLGDMGLAADIAKNRHIDLNSAVDLMAKTMAGNITAAKRMGIEIPPEILKIKDPAEKARDIMAILEGHFKGSAAAAADTFSGRMDKMKAQASNLGEQLGTKLIPILEGLMTWISKVVTWFEKHQEAAKALGIILGVLAGALIAVGVAAFIAENAMTLGIGLAIGLLILGIYELWKHWGQIWGDIKQWVNDAWTYIKPVWDTIYAYLIGPLIQGVQQWIQIFKQAFQDAKQWVSDAWNNVIQPVWGFINQYVVGPLTQGIQTWIGIFKQVWQDAGTAVQWAWNNIIQPVWGDIQTGYNTLKTLFDDLKTAWSAAWNAAGTTIQWAYDNLIKPVIDTMTSAINTVKGVWDFLFGGGGAAQQAAAVKPGSTAQGSIHRAGGGPVSAMSPYIVGENGPELFIPGSSGQIIPNGGGGSAFSAGGAGSGGAPTTINLVVNGQTFATAMTNDLWTAFLQKKRSVVSLNLG